MFIKSIGTKNARHGCDAACAIREVKWLSNEMWCASHLPAYQSLEISLQCIFSCFSLRIFLCRVKVKHIHTLAIARDAQRSAVKQRNVYIANSNRPHSKIVQIMHYHVKSGVVLDLSWMWHIIMLKRFIHVFALIMCEIKIYAQPVRGERGPCMHGVVTVPCSHTLKYRQSNSLKNYYLCDLFK